LQRDPSQRALVVANFRAQAGAGLWSPQLHSS